MGNGKVVLLFLLFSLLSPVVFSGAETSPAELQQAVSDALDLWREGRYEQLFERLGHRGGTSREAFAKKMNGAAFRPACCFQKMENFRVLNEKRNQATVYVTVGLEGAAGSTERCTREFRMRFEDGVWKMRLNDLLAVAGVSGKKGKSRHR